MYPEAIREFQKVRELSQGRGGDMGLARAYAVAGRRREALTMVDELSEKSKLEYVPAYAFAAIYIALGENDHGFEWLEKAFSQHDPNIKELKVDPLLDSIRSDPRFTDLLRRMKLAS
jgi:tetratricopeptide (TPR) repeat protein